MKKFLLWRFSLGLFLALAGVHLAKAQCVPVSNFTVRVYSVNLSTGAQGAQLTGSSQLTPGTTYIVYVSGVGYTYNSLDTNPARIQIRTGDGFTPGFLTGSSSTGYTFNPLAFPFQYDTGSNVSAGIATIRFYVKTPDDPIDMVRPLYFSIRAMCYRENFGYSTWGTTVGRQAPTP